MSDTSKQVDEIKDAIWKAIKDWDIERKRGDGYAGATGTDVEIILNAIEAQLTAIIESAQAQLLRELIEEMPEEKQKDFISKNGLGTEENRQKFYRYGGYDFALNQALKVLERKLAELESKE
jgi:hypothetical protein